MLGRLLLLKNGSALQEPFRVTFNLAFGYIHRGVAEVCVIFAHIELFAIHILVLAVHLAHFLDLVEVYDEAALVRVVLLDALAAENGQMIRAVEVLHALIVPLAEQAVNAILIFKVDIAQDRVTFHDLEQDIEVER